MEHIVVVIKYDENLVPVTYKGKSYRSKSECIFKERITRHDLNKYLKRDKDEVL